MKKYSILHIPFLSFFKKDLYQDVCLNWKGVCFTYLFILLFLCWIFPSYQIHNEFSHFVKTGASDYISQIPTITIKNGEASADVEQPYQIIDPETQEILVVIDTTGTITSLSQAGARGLITKYEAIFQKSKIETRSFTFQDIEDLVFDQEMAYDGLKMIEKFIGPIIFIFALPFSFIARIILSLIYASIGLLISSIFKTNRNYSELLRLSVVAMTPTIIVSTILDGLRIYLPYSGLIYFLVTIGYLSFGIKSSKENINP